MARVDRHPLTNMPVAKKLLATTGLVLGLVLFAGSTWFEVFASDWGASENNRRARFYRLTKEGRKQLQVETQDWEQTAAIIGRFFEVKAEDLP